MGTGHYQDASPDGQSYLVCADGTGMYDGTSTSSESSASSPLNCNGYENFYGAASFLTYPSFPMQYPTNGECAVPAGMIPVELDIEGLYEDHDRRRRKSGPGKVVPSHVHSRRRAQNRASQRAFRDRKEKHMRELEQRLDELETQHNDLSRSYESLQLEYSSMKQEVGRLHKENDRLEKSSTGLTKDYFSSHKAWEESKGEIVDPLLFDVSAFCFDQEDGDQKSD